MNNDNVQVHDDGKWHSKYIAIIRQNSSSTFLVERHATNFVAFPYKYSEKKNDFYSDGTYMSAQLNQLFSDFCKNTKTTLYLLLNSDDQ